MHSDGKTGFVRKIRDSGVWLSKRTRHSKRFGLQLAESRRRRLRDWGCCESVLRGWGRWVGVCLSRSRQASWVMARLAQERKVAVSVCRRRRMCGEWRMAALCRTSEIVQRVDKAGRGEREDPRLVCVVRGYGYSRAGQTAASGQPRGREETSPHTSRNHHHHQHQHQHHPPAGAFDKWKAVELSKLTGGGTHRARSCYLIGPQPTAKESARLAPRRKAKQTGLRCCCPPPPAAQDRASREGLVVRPACDLLKASFSRQHTWEEGKGGVDRIEEERKESGFCSPKPPDWPRIFLHISPFHHQLSNSSARDLYT